MDPSQQLGVKIRRGPLLMAKLPERAAPPLPRWDNDQAGNLIARLYGPEDQRRYEAENLGVVHACEGEQQTYNSLGEFLYVDLQLHPTRVAGAGDAAVEPLLSQIERMKLDTPSHN